MSYLVIARKWRPLVFEDVVGQEHVTTTLRNAIASKRIGHAYIFSGPRGVGKTTSARILAKAINCENGGPTPTPCNTCSTCQDITAGRYLDVLEIDGASNRGIEEIRNLRETVRFLPVRGRYKIYIIDEFHMITKDAFNALLKTLEEPPPQVIFVFATTEPHKILPTILSRCQRFDFKRVPLSITVDRLRQICTKEGLTIDNESLFAIGQQADGGMRDAMTLLDQVISFCGNTIRIDQTREALGLINQTAYFDLLETVHGRNTSGIFERMTQVLDSGWDLTEFSHGLMEHVRNLLVLRSGAGSLLTDVFEGYLQRLQEQSQWYDEPDLLRMLNLLSECLQRMRWSSKPRYVLEMTLLKMAFLDDTVSLTGLIGQIEGGKLSIAEPEKKKPEPVVTPPASSSAVLPSHLNSTAPLNAASLDIVSGWPDFVAVVKEKKIRVGAILEQATPGTLEGDQLTIRLDPELAQDIHIEIIEKERDYLGEITKLKFGRKLKIKATRETPAPSASPSQDSLFDHYPVIHAETASFVESEERAKTELFTYLRKLEQETPLKDIIAQLDCELVSLELKK